MNNLKPVTMPTRYTVADAATLAVLIRYADYLNVRVMTVVPATNDRWNHYGFKVTLGNAVDITNKTDLTRFAGDLDPMRTWWQEISQHVSS